MWKWALPILDMCQNKTMTLTFQVVWKFLTHQLYLKFLYICKRFPLLYWSNALWGFPLLFLFLFWPRYFIIIILIGPSRALTEGSRYFSGKLINVPYTGPVLRGVRIQYAVTCCLAVVSVLSTVIIWIDACTTASSHRVQAMLWNLRAMSGSRRNIHRTNPGA